jgi:sulfoxide reductase heme-binding subunit YedZ
MHARPEPGGGFVTAFVVAVALGVTALSAVALNGRSLSPMTWYLARSSGMVLYLLLWLGTVLGLGLTTTLFSHFRGRAVVYSLHAYATSLAYAFLALHVLTLAVDQSVRFTPQQFVVPFSSAWREPWTGFGVLAGQLTVITGGSVLVRHITGYRVWRALHWLTFPLYALGLAHGIGAGTDSAAWWAMSIYVFTALSVVWMTLYRVLRGPHRVRLRLDATRPLDRLLATDQTRGRLEAGYRSR